MVLGTGSSTFLQLLDHIQHTLLALLVACSGIEGKGCEIVTAYVAVKTVPVRESLCLFRKTSLLAVRSQDTVNIILKEHVDVKVASMLQRTVEKGDVAKREGVMVEGGLGVGVA